MKASSVYVTPVLALLMIFHLNPADAVADIITKTWTYEITDRNGSFVESEYGLGEIGRFTATYDDDSLIGTNFNDGQNGTPFDGDDEYLDDIQLNVSMMSDITDIDWDLSEAFNEYLPLRQDEYDRNTKKITETTIERWVEMVDLTVTQSDTERVGTRWRMYIVDEIGGEFYLEYFRETKILETDVTTLDHGNQLWGVVSSIETTHHMEPVPEPATMLLFGTGLAGLAGYRKRKAMKK